MNSFKVNALVIRTSDRGTTGYYGVTFSPAWTMDEEIPFIACLSNPVDDPKLEKWLTAKQRNSLHLGRFSDSREAAYVVSMYHENPEEILKELYYNGKIHVDFPSELYNLPEFCSLQDAKNKIKASKQKNNEKKSVAKKPKSMKLSDALATARDTIGKRKAKNIPAIRKYIESNLKTFKNKQDVENAVKSMAKF